MNKEVINTEENKTSPLRCAELLKEFEEKEALPMGEKLRFSGVGEDDDIYNISKPFQIDGETVIAGRVEARKEWANSRAVFFKEKEGTWFPIEGAPTFRLEDGFATTVGEETVFGGVQVYLNHSEVDSQGVSYRTVFYRGKSLSSLEQFAIGPDGMKGIRLAALEDGHIGVCTRPQGGSNGRGKIGYIELNNLEGLNAQNLFDAKIIEGQFQPEEWGGANELHPLQDGRIGIVGHIAHEDEQGNKHYYAMSFKYDPKTHSASPIEIIATRKSFPVGNYKTLTTNGKTIKVEDVVYPSSLLRHGDGTATLYAGLSDTEAGVIEVPDPFFEN